VGPDQAFLEQRRKGLTRFINFVVNHPILSVDGCVGVFLSEPNFEGWRKRTKVSLEEESTSKKLDPAAEMAIPADLSAKIDAVRNTLPLLVESHSKLVVLAEKGLKRLEAASADESRMAMTLATLGERHADACWRNANGLDGSAANGHQAEARGSGCELCQGIGRGLSAVSHTWARQGEELERRVSDLSFNG
jgi:sorting nexin-8